MGVEDAEGGYEVKNQKMIKKKKVKKLLGSMRHLGGEVVSVILPNFI
jgi:hypothetical protein